MTTTEFELNLAQIRTIVGNALKNTANDDYQDTVLFRLSNGRIEVLQPGYDAEKEPALLITKPLEIRVTGTGVVGDVIECPDCHTHGSVHVNLGSLVNENEKLLLHQILMEEDDVFIPFGESGVSVTEIGECGECGHKAPVSQFLGA